MDVSLAAQTITEHISGCTARVCLYHSVPSLPSFISIAVPTVTAEVASLSVNTAATWIAGEQHFHYVPPPKLRHYLTGVCL